MSLRVYVRVRVFVCVRARVRHYVITELEGNEGDRKQENKMKQKYIYISFFPARVSRCSIVLLLLVAL